MKICDLDGIKLQYLTDDDVPVWIEIANNYLKKNMSYIVYLYPRLYTVGMW